MSKSLIYGLILPSLYLVIWTWSLYINIPSKTQLPSNSDMVEWLHSTLRNAQDKLTTRINKQSLQVPDCQSAEEVSGFLNYRKTPSEMRRRRGSELHVAQTKTQGRNFLLKLTKFYHNCWQVPLYKVITGPKHYIVNKVTIMYSQSAAFHSSSLPLSSTNMNLTCFLIFLLFD